MDGFIKLVLSILIFVGVLFLTQITTKYIAKLQKINMQGNNISVVETQRLSNNKILYIVKIGQEYFALASGKDTVSVIGKIDSQGLLLPLENQEGETADKKFSQSFSSVLDKITKKQDKE